MLHNLIHARNDRGFGIIVFQPENQDRSIDRGSWPTLEPNEAPAQLAQPRPRPLEHRTAGAGCDDRGPPRSPDHPVHPLRPSLVISTPSSRFSLLHNGHCPFLMCCCPRAARLGRCNLWTCACRLRNDLCNPFRHPADGSARQRRRGRTGQLIQR
jgi:hypothetical protein